MLSMLDIIAYSLLSASMFDKYLISWSLKNIYSEVSSKILEFCIIKSMPIFSLLESALEMVWICSDSESVIFIIY